MSGPENQPADAALEAERAAVAAIGVAHQREVDRARRVAEGLAIEAAEQTEEGIRDLVDDDAEVDAAVQAALVRQTSDRAMHAARRVAELEAQGEALAFGHITNDDGERLYVGRMSVLDGDDALLVDWRARASIPFYRATPLDRLDIAHRRHLLYGTEPETSSELIGYSDEVFAFDGLDTEIGLRGEAAILAAVTAPTREQMQSVVATIQAEQDAVIRAASQRTLVVQGGPGTGKTVVALHRAAYLLYDQRAALADSGVLVVGPSNEFLRYIAGVLPSLGESGVVSVTAAKLYPGILLGGRDGSAVAAVKSSGAMAPFLAAAIADRRRRPKAPLEVYYGSRRVVLSVEQGAALFERACRHRAHNDGAGAFRSFVVDRLSEQVYNPSFENMDDARATFRRSTIVEAYLLRHFPSLTPERALRDLFGSKALLRSAAASAGIDDGDAASLFRPPAAEDELESIRWTDADVPLLDELHELLGGSMGQSEEEQQRARDARDEFEMALQRDVEASPHLEIGDIVELPVDDEPDDDEEDELAAYVSTAELEDEEGDGEGGATDDRAIELDDDDDDVRVDELELEGADDLEEESATVVELAFGQRSWRFGHVIVDEAQDLTPMQWRMVVRRARGGAMTIVGDLAQRSIGAPGTWREHLPPSIREFDRRELTINYRSPAEINDLASTVLTELAPSLATSTSIRSSGHQPEAIAVDSSVETLQAAVSRVIGEVVADPGIDGSIGVVGLGLHGVAPVSDGNDAGEGDQRATWLDPWQAKGLEFDTAIVVEPARFLEEPHGLSLLYVAITRATKKLIVVHEQTLPAVLAGLRN